MAVKPVFLDSNGWVALLNTRDALHVRADAVWRELGRADRSIVLTDWILAETGNSLARTTSRPRFPEGVQRLLANPKVNIVQVGVDLRTRALAMYAERPDKTWGLVDCASFLVMSAGDITEAFSTDHHFEQAGFTCLLPVDSG